jgi:enamine deaminase RidA (YjgF/YER057c/UK114 family)
MSILQRLKERGLTLPEPSAPVANYLPYKMVVDHMPPEGILYTAGMIPLAGGKPVYTGRLGAEQTVEQGAECAVHCTLNGLAWASQALAGNLDRIAEVVRVNGYVAGTPDFFDQPQVINGCSDLLVGLFGEAGKHTRTAIGVASLPLNVPVQLDFIFRVS